VEREKKEDTGQINTEGKNSPSFRGESGRDREIFPRGEGEGKKPGNEPLFAVISQPGPTRGRKKKRGPNTLGGKKKTNPTKSAVKRKGKSESVMKGECPVWPQKEKKKKRG